MKYFKRSVILFFSFAAIFCIASCHDNVSKPADKQAALHKIFVDSFPEPSGYINDYENIFSANEEKILTDLAGEIEKNDSMQITVISFDTSMIAKDSLDAVTLRIANEWGVGQKYKNNGITIGICIGHRKIRIQNGLGIEKILSNAETKQIIDSIFIPAFGDAQFFRGTFDGINALVSRINKTQLLQQDN